MSEFIETELKKGLKPPQVPPQVSVVKYFLHPAAACASSAVEPRRGMSMEGGRMREIEEMLEVRLE